MKYLLSLLFSLVLVTSLSAQIKGNGQIKTLTQNVSNLKNIDIQFNANFILDYNQEEVLVIEADENVLEYIGLDFKNGNLLIDQKKWIAPSQQPTITIGTPNLKSVFQGTHSTTKIVNINGEQLTLEGNVGKIIAQGEINELIINTEKAKVDANNLSIGIVRINDNCKSIVKLNKYEKLIKGNSADVVLDFKNPKSSILQKEKDTKSKKVTYIKFKIKNNSAWRNSYYVKGPNGKGGNFSYGFSLFPYGKKAEKWSIGTKVFKESRGGRLTELVTITGADEGRVVQLH